MGGSPLTEVKSMSTDFSREGGDPPNTRTKRRSRRLSGPGRQAMQDLCIIFFIFASELKDLEAGAALRANVRAWMEMYCGKI